MSIQHILRGSLLALLASAPLFAQSGINSSLSSEAARPPQTEEAAPVATPVAASAGVKLNDENIPAFFANLGYEVKKTESGNYELDTKRGTFRLYTNLMIDEDTGKVWMYAYLREIKGEMVVPSECLMKLLEANLKIGPTHFYVSKNKIFIGRAFENENVTAAKFRQEFDAFFADCQTTEDLWTVDNWPTSSSTQLSSTAPVPAPAQ